jgi:hypothetical protein
MTALQDIQISELLPESRKTTLGECGISTARAFEVDYTPAYLAAHPDPDNLDPDWVAQHFYDPETGSTAPMAYRDPHPTLRGAGNACYVSEIKVEALDRACRVWVSYTPAAVDTKADASGWVWEFAWTSTQQHITSTTLGQMHYPAWADTGWVIGADGEEVHGCDAYRPTGTLKVSKIFTTYPTTMQIKTWMDRQACVNSDGFAGGIIAAGEALFVGFNIIPQRKGEFLVEFNFLIAKAQPAATFTLIDGSSYSVQIGPWQYVWFRHAGKIGSKGDSGEAAGQKCRQNGIESVHVATLYKSASFAAAFGFSGPRY